MSNLVYKGNCQPAHDEKDPLTEQVIYPYLPDAALVEAVNLAIFLKRPLLLKGEPGCGKTRLAGAVAYELGLPLKAWYIKSISRARDGLYTYDAVGRLRDAQLAASRAIGVERAHHISDPTAYVRWGPMGEAFLSQKRTVLLIDEIDKADIDFPNDLLLELDERRFKVEETGEEIRATHSPIVFITSNDEKDLPDAFLRRCVFHHVEFPNDDQLLRIVKSRFPQASSQILTKTIERFLALRTEMSQGSGAANKKVTTSELLDWFNVLQNYPDDEILSKLEGKLPFAGVLLKSWEAHQRYLKQSN
ncbi:MAG: MoxR family ATPase [Tildeniella torsiva UHER 1998/13D]|jgi:MoxR-like ATPase|nr:MoxR family ATPase [Tildeniella torsiva UHER 1998/13D]